ncbi:hypothetical protein OG604_38940 [Streptomyces sp. NBC_01231]|nr:hypothetical protein OG604_38940 [Streptomyces sp. NBC_01231]
MTASLDQVFSLSAASSEVCRPNRTGSKGESTFTLHVGGEVISEYPIVVPSEEVLTSTPLFIHQATKSPIKVGIDGHTVPAAVMIFFDRSEPSHLTNHHVAAGACSRRSAHC